MNNQPSRSAQSEDIDYNATLQEDQNYRPLADYEIVGNGPSAAKRRKRKSFGNESTAAIVDRYFGQKTKVKENGKARTVTIREAIELTLYKEGLAGNRRAVRVLDMYLRLAQDETRSEKRVIALYEFEGALYREVDEK